MTIPIIWHDTITILDANQEALDLFQCERHELVDQLIERGAYGHDMQWLVKLRMLTIREKGEMPERPLAFMRSDGSVFWAETKTTRDGDRWQTTLKYISEY